MWGCKTHWFKLPKQIRDEIWRTFRPGQEKNWTPSPAYIEAAKEAQAWITQWHGEQNPISPNAPDQRPERENP